MALVKVLRHGQVTLPKEFREKLGINEGDLMEAELEGKRILFKPKVLVDKGAVSPAAAAAEQQAWGRLAAQQLDKAYGAAEPDYSPSLIKESNPEYQP
jgi:AbrB family looped-hinge helix DNA binding protein